VWENDDKTATVAAIDAKVMLTVTGRDDMEEMANQINKLLQKAIDSA